MTFVIYLTDISATVSLKLKKATKVSSREKPCSADSETRTWPAPEEIKVRFHQLLASSFPYVLFQVSVGMKILPPVILV